MWLSLHDRERDRKLGAVPGELQHATLPCGVDADGELLRRCSESLRRQIQARDISLRIVLRSPLPGLAVDDELGSAGRWKRPQSVLACRQVSASEHQIAGRGDLRGCVSAGAPYPAIRDNVAAEDRSAAT